MKELIKKLGELVTEAIETSNYALINKAFELAYENGIFMEEDDEYIAIEDDIYYVNGAF